MKKSDADRVKEAKQILLDALKYAEFDGHDMPKRPVRRALAALGVPEDEQP